MSAKLINSAEISVFSHSNYIGNFEAKLVVRCPRPHITSHSKATSEATTSAVRHLTSSLPVWIALGFLLGIPFYEDVAECH